MTPTGLVIIGIAGPALVLTLLRANAVLVFLSLCLGQVLAQFAGEEAARTVGIIASDGRTNPSAVSLGLLLGPAVFTTLFMMRTVKGKLRLAVNLLPAVAAGFLGFLLTEPFLSSGMRASIEATEAWHIVQQLQVIVIVVSAIMCLFFLWLQRPRRGLAEEKLHHK